MTSSDHFSLCLTVQEKLKWLHSDESTCFSTETAHFWGRILWELLLHPNQRENGPEVKRIGFHLQPATLADCNQSEIVEHILRVPRMSIDRWIERSIEHVQIPTDSPLPSQPNQNKEEISMLRDMQGHIYQALSHNKNNRIAQHLVKSLSLSIINGSMKIIKEILVKVREYSNVDVSLSFIF